MHRLPHLCACLLLAAPLLVAAESPQEAAKARVKSLQGDWTAQEERGDGVLVHFSVIDRRHDTGVIEDIRYHDDPPREYEFHLGPEGLSLDEYARDFTTTHRLHYGRISWEKLAETPGRWEFVFWEPRWIGSKPVLARLELIFDDADHFTQRWTWRRSGAEEVVALHFTRKRPSD